MQDFIKHWMPFWFIPADPEKYGQLPTGFSKQFVLKLEMASGKETVMTRTKANIGYGIPFEADITLNIVRDGRTKQNVSKDQRDLTDHPEELI